jgi:hypothetical protein
MSITEIEMKCTMINVPNVLIEELDKLAKREHRSRRAQLIVMLERELGCRVGDDAGHLSHQHNEEVSA